MTPPLDIEPPSCRRAGLVVLGLAFALGGPGGSESLADSPTDLRDDTIRRLRAQPVGNHTLEVMQLPEAFLGRVADRVIQMSYQNLHRRVEGQSLPAGTRSAETAQPDATRPRGNRPRSERSTGREHGGLLVAAAALAALVVVMSLRRSRERRRADRDRS